MWSCTAGIQASGLAGAPAANDGFLWSTVTVTGITAERFKSGISLMLPAQHADDGGARHADGHTHITHRFVY